MSMRITLVSPFDPTPGVAADRAGHVGGVERVFAEVARDLAGRGHDVTVVCSTDGPGGRTHSDGVRKVRRHRWSTLFRDPVVRLHRDLTDDADVVHVPATYPFTTTSVLRRADRLGVPSVLDFHFEPSPPSAAGRAAARVYRWFAPSAYRRADAVVVRSMAYGRRAPSLAKVPERRWHVVPNGIDTDRFRPDGHGSSGDYLLFVGRLVPYKGLEVLLRAMARRPPGLPLVVAGDGPLRQPLEHLAARLRVDARFLGYVPDDELPGLYRGARATALPSVNGQEAFGITLLESMACGTPVVASDLPGVADVARLGGLVAPPGDASLLAARIEDVLDGAHGPRGRELADRIRRRFSWHAVAGRMLDVYRDVVDGPGGATGREVTTDADPGGHPVL